MRGILVTSSMRPVKGFLKLLLPLFATAILVSRRKRSPYWAFFARQIAGAARELLQSLCDFDTVGLQVPTSVSVMCTWEIPVKCGMKELNIEKRLMIY